MAKTDFSIAVFFNKNVILNICIYIYTVWIKIEEIVMISQNKDNIKIPTITKYILSKYSCYTEGVCKYWKRF